MLSILLSFLSFFLFSPCWTRDTLTVTGHDNETDHVAPLWCQSVWSQWGSSLTRSSSDKTKLTSHGTQTGKNGREGQKERGRWVGGSTLLSICEPNREEGRQREIISKPSLFPSLPSPIHNHCVSLNGFKGSRRREKRERREVGGGGCQVQLWAFPFTSPEMTKSHGFPFNDDEAWP